MVHASLGLAGIGIWTYSRAVLERAAVGRLALANARCRVITPHNVKVMQDIDGDTHTHARKVFLNQDESNFLER